MKKLTNESLSLKNALNKAINQLELLENKHKESQQEKQQKEMELFKTELFLNIEKVNQAKQETEEELYKANIKQQKKNFSFFLQDFEKNKKSNYQ